MSLDPTVPSFATLELDDRLTETLAAMGFDTPTPIQLQAIPHLLEGRDVIGGARTGSGKTAAFGLPLLEMVKDGGKKVRAIVLCPTRELALQVTEAVRSMAKKLPVQLLTVYGGAPFPPQLQALKRGVPVVVGTPGRVLDHARRGSLDLSNIEMFVLDEADEMLRMGFIEDVEELLKMTPEERQVALFSATMPPPIRKIAKRHLNNPVQIQVEGESLTTSHITQQVVFVPQRNKLDALERILDATVRDATLVFARTRRGCAEIADALAVRGISVDAIHGDLAQPARERVLAKLRAKRVDVVVATDVAARGIDVTHITHVINLDMPDDPEIYVHRIGRTGRAGRPGTAISLVTPRERSRIKRFQKAIDAPIEEIQVPSDEQIDKGRRDRLLARLYERVSEGPKERTIDFIDELDENIDLMSILCASLEMNAAEEGIDLDFIPSADPPAWTRGKTRTRREREDNVGFEDGVELMVGAGRHKGLRPGDVVGALTNEKNVPGGAIGKVTVLPRRTFVMLNRSEAERLAGTTFFLRGNEVELLWANPDDAPSDKPQKVRVRKGGGAREDRDRGPRGRGPRDRDAPRDTRGERPRTPGPRRSGTDKPATDRPAAKRPASIKSGPEGPGKKKRYEKPEGPKQRWRKGEGKGAAKKGAPKPGGKKGGGKLGSDKPPGFLPPTEKRSKGPKAKRPGGKTSSGKPAGKKGRFGAKPKAG